MASSPSPVCTGSIPNLAGTTTHPDRGRATTTAYELQLADREVLFVDDRRVCDEYRFDGVDELGIRASFGDAIVEICRRNEHFMIRPRHPDHANRTGYRGTPTYPANTDWVIRGRLTPHDRPQTVTVAASVEGLTHVYESPGEVDFVLAGQSLRLIAFNGEESGELFFVFTDATSGVTTYPACRFLDVDPPGADNHVTLDFNRATNPPCAYTDFATCPLPPPGNHLPVRVEAGERLPLAPP